MLTINEDELKDKLETMAMEGSLIVWNIDLNNIMDLISTNVPTDMNLQNSY